MMELVVIFVAATITQNFVLTYFLGICPFIGVSNKLSSAVGMGMATTFVMTLASAVTWVVNYYLLERFGLPFLQYGAFIICIAGLVQIVEMFIKKSAPALYHALGIFLPLITTNCAVLGLTLFMVMRKYNFAQAVMFGFAGGLGFSIALIIMSGIREEIEYGDVPEAMKGVGITLVIAGMLALAFMGFAGLISA